MSHVNVLLAGLVCLWAPTECVNELQLPLVTSTLGFIVVSLLRCQTRSLQQRITKDILKALNTSGPVRIITMILKD